MADQFVGEIRMFGGGYAPNGWSFCDGQTLVRAQNASLFSLIGTVYGSPSGTTFQLPDLRGRVPIHMGARPDGSTYTRGQTGGSETVALNASMIPAHTHSLGAQTGNANSADPAGSVLAATALDAYTSSNNRSIGLDSAAIADAGSGTGHENMAPFEVINFIIALTGIFPNVSS